MLLDSHSQLTQVKGYLAVWQPKLLMTLANLKPVEPTIKSKEIVFENLVLEYGFFFFFFLWAHIFGKTLYNFLFDTSVFSGSFYTSDETVIHWIGNNSQKWIKYLGYSPINLLDKQFSKKELGQIQEEQYIKMKSGRKRLRSGQSFEDDDEDCEPLNNVVSTQEKLQQFVQHKNYFLMEKWTIYVNETLQGSVARKYSAEKGCR